MKTVFFLTFVFLSASCSTMSTPTHGGLPNTVLIAGPRPPETFAVVGSGTVRGSLTFGVPLKMKAACPIGRYIIYPSIEVTTDWDESTQTVEYSWQCTKYGSLSDTYRIYKVLGTYDHRDLKVMKNNKRSLLGRILEAVLMGSIAAMATFAVLACLAGIVGGVVFLMMKLTDNRDVSLMFGIFTLLAGIFVPMYFFDQPNAEQDKQ